MPEVFLQVQRQDGKVEPHPGNTFRGDPSDLDPCHHWRSSLSRCQPKPGAMMQRITREQSRKYAFDWEDTHLVIGDRLPHLADLFSNRKLEAKSETLALADLGNIPFAVFHNMKRSSAAGA